MRRLPKTVQICGKTYPVKQVKDSYDGGGGTAKPSLWVGTKPKTPERIFEIFVHEVMELVACERGDRYGSGVSDDSMFVMNHKEFDNFSVDVAAAIRPMLKD